MAHVDSCHLATLDWGSRKAPLPLDAPLVRVVDTQLVGAPAASAVHILISLNPTVLYAAYLALPTYEIRATKESAFQVEKSENAL